MCFVCSIFWFPEFWSRLKKQKHKKFPCKFFFNLYLHIKFSAWSGECVVDGTPRVLPHRINKPKMTPTLCIASCSAQGYILAGVQNGGECHCGNTDPPISKFAPEEECNKACAGDGNLICGGSWRLSVFSTGAGCFLHFNSFGGLNSPTGWFVKIGLMNLVFKQK